MRRRLIIPYTSGFFTVVLPTLFFLIVFFSIWIGIPTLLNLRWGWSIPDWFPLLTCGLGIVAGLGLAVVVYPLFLRLAEGRQGELLLEGERLCWRLGWRRRQIDFTRPHKAKIAAGYSALGSNNASITFYPDSEIIHLHGVSREVVLRYFPVPYFVDRQAITPTEGLGALSSKPRTQMPGISSSPCWSAYGATASRTASSNFMPAIPGIASRGRPLTTSA